MQVHRQLGYCLLLLGSAALFAAAGNAQAIRVVRRSMLMQPDTAVKSLTVSVSPASVSFSLVSHGVAAASGAIEITTAWAATTCSSTCTVNLYAYFTSSTAALSASTGGDIPSSAVLGQVPTGSPTTYTAFTQTGVFGAAGASLLLFSDVISTHTAKTSRTDALNLEINLSGQPQQPAGSYTGTLNIQAQTL